MELGGLGLRLECVLGRTRVIKRGTTVFTFKYFITFDNTKRVDKYIRSIQSCHSVKTLLFPSQRF